MILLIFFIQDLNDKDKLEGELDKIIIATPSKKDDIYYSDMDLVLQSPRLKINKINKKIK